MAAVFQALGTVQTGSANQSVPWPTHQADDIGILFVVTDGTAPAATWPPTGWTLLEASPNAPASVTLYAAWKRAASGSEGSVTVNIGGSSLISAILTVRGALKSADPIGSLFASRSATNEGTGWITDGTAVNCVENSCFISALGAKGAGSAGHFTTWAITGTDAPSHTERCDTSFGNFTLGIDTGNKGATGTDSLYGSSYIDIANADSCQYTINVKPEPVLNAKFFLMF